MIALLFQVIVIEVFFVKIVDLSFFSLKMLVNHVLLVPICFVLDVG